MFFRLNVLKAKVRLINLNVAARNKLCSFKFAYKRCLTISISFLVYQFAQHIFNFWKFDISNTQPPTKKCKIATIWKKKLTEPNPTPLSIQRKIGVSLPSTKPRARVRSQLLKYSKVIGARIPPFDVRTRRGLSRGAPLNNSRSPLSPTLPVRANIISPRITTTFSSLFHTPYLEHKSHKSRGLGSAAVYTCNPRDSAGAFN